MNMRSYRDTPRLYAAIKAGLTEVPALIYPLDRNQAVIAVVDSNLHREKLLPSEKAFAYKMKLEAIKRQGKRTDLTFRQVVGRLESADAVSSEESGRQVQRYICLTNLIPELLQKVDEGAIAFSPAVELSYLTEKQQEILLDAMVLNDCTPSHAQSIRLMDENEPVNLAQALTPRCPDIRIESGKLVRFSGENEFSLKIGGTTYEVNTHFSSKGKQSVLEQFKELILSDYAKKNGYSNTMFFVDDGVSGTTFQRPNFMRMERMAENGEISTIIVKDLSRFGREAG